MARVSRREFLTSIGITAAALLAGCRPADRPPPPTIYVRGSFTRLPPTPSAAPGGMPSAQASPLPLPTSVPITEQRRLYVKSFRDTPDISKWHGLRIDGLVEHPLTLTMDDIRALPQIEAMRSLECISNPVGGGLIGNLIWIGAELAPLLARAGIRPEAKYALFEASDGYTTSVALKWLTQPGVLLAHRANGEPLLPEHGYPLRLLIPGLYGQKQPKWITHIRFAAEDSLGYWENEARGWSNTAEVRTNSQLRVPKKVSEPFAAVIRLEGLAFAGLRAITRVEVGIDDARPRLQATLISPPSPLVWTWWVCDWQPPAPGLYRLTVHATDETDFTQERIASGPFGAPFPDGTDAVHQLVLRLS